MGLFGKSKTQLEKENQMLRELLAKQTTTQKKTSAPKKKQVLYQCRYCGLKSIRNATDGAPTTTAPCPRHPRGWCKGQHSYMRTYL